MSASTGVTAAAGTYVHWGVVQISVANLIVVGVMVVLFVLALLLPFPGAHGTRSGKDRS